MFTNNMGRTDRGIRAVVGLVALILFITGTVSGALGWIALIVGLALLGTAAIGWCPPYSLLGINTCSAKKT
jgi:hypothetical protein